MSSAEIHREPLSISSISGTTGPHCVEPFYFERMRHLGRWQIVDDQQLPGAKVGAARASVRRPSRSATRPSRSLTTDGKVAAVISTDERAWGGWRFSNLEIDYHYRIEVDGEEGLPGNCGTGSPVTAWRLRPRPCRAALRPAVPYLADPRQPLRRRFASWPWGTTESGVRADAESSRRQRRIADVLERLVADHDVRFVLSLGDNIYQGEQGRVDQRAGERTTTGTPASSSPTVSPSRACRSFRPSATTIAPTPRAATTAPRWRTTSTSANLPPRPRDGVRPARIVLPTAVRRGSRTCLPRHLLDSEQKEIHRLPGANHPGVAALHLRPARRSLARSVLPPSVYTAGPNHENDEEMGTRSTVVRRRRRAPRPRRS